MKIKFSNKQYIPILRSMNAAKVRVLLTDTEGGSLLFDRYVEITDAIEPYLGTSIYMADLFQKQIQLLIGCLECQENDLPEAEKKLLPNLYKRLKRYAQPAGI